MDTKTLPLAAEFTTNDVCFVAGVSPTRVRRLVQASVIKPVVVGSRGRGQTDKFTFMQTVAVAAAAAHLDAVVPLDDLDPGPDQDLPSYAILDALPGRPCERCGNLYGPTVAMTTFEIAAKPYYRKCWLCSTCYLLQLYS